MWTRPSNSQSVTKDGGEVGVNTRNSGNQKGGRAGDLLSRVIIMMKMNTGDWNASLTMITIKEISFHIHPDLESFLSSIYWPL